MDQHKHTSNRSNQFGFSLPQLLITLAVVSVVVAIAVMGVTRGRASMRLSNSTRQFAAYIVAPFLHYVRIVTRRSQPSMPHYDPVIAACVKVGSASQSRANPMD